MLTIDKWRGLGRGVYIEDEVRNNVSVEKRIRVVERKGNETGRFVVYSCF